MTGASEADVVSAHLLSFITSKLLKTTRIWVTKEYLGRGKAFESPSWLLTCSCMIA